MNDRATVVDSAPFCLNDDRFAGAAEVVEISIGQGKRTIGLRLRVGSRFVHLPRHRVNEVVKAIEQARDEASSRYTQLLQEMNKDERY